ncbi:tetratricopeptide repeat protein [Winogradskyella sp. HB-48]|uniref:tetratricopeptide repeat protein n=1 Tax=Winogradskyella sp. HB-48 TaxID=3416808 RepID=UPI003CEED01E
MKLKYLFLLLPSLVLGQDFMPLLNESIQQSILAGDDCLKQNGEDCLSYYDKAIEMAKNMPDSTLIMTYKEITGGLLWYGNIKDAERYTREGLATSDAKSYPTTMSYLYKRLGEVFVKTEMTDSVIPAYKKALEWAKKANDYLQITDAHILMADVYHRLGKTKRAIEMLTLAKPYADQSPNYRQRIGIVYVMGNIYLANKDYTLAKERFEEALEMSLGKDEIMYHFSKINWCMTMNFLNQPLEVIDQLPQTIAFLEGDNNQLSANTQLAKAFLLNGDYEKSLQLSLTNLEKAKTINNQNLVSLNSRMASENYLKMGKTNMGLQYAAMALNSEKSKGSIDEQVLDAYKLKAMALKANNQWKEATETLDTYQVLNDSLYTLEKQKEILNLQEYYESEVKNTKIQLQQEEIKTLNAKSANDQLTKTLYAIGMFSFLAIAGLLYFSFNQRIKKNKAEREKQEEIYKQEIEFKQKELASQTLHLVQKNTFIQELKENLEKIKHSPELFKVEFRRLVMLLKKESAEDKDWEVFKSYFSEVHNNFDNKIKAISKEISEKEIRLASFLRMNLSTKEIASMLNVLPDSVLKSKYRLKKKLDLDKDEDLTEFLNTL